MLVRDKDITSEGNLGGNKIAMTLDEQGLSHIMSLLTNLYSDPALAAIRETCTNAIDSHIAAGQTKPIEVSTPNRLYPYFVVKDFGTGMSVDDVINIVSKYGASTKRQSDDYNGMMGIGLKSPLAYTDQFTIIGIKDGKRASILVTRSKNGASDMEIVDVADTSEHNGVTIKIPVNTDYVGFSNKVMNFAKYVESGKLKVNEKFVSHGMTKIGPDIFIEKPEYWGDRQDKIVMGNVAYPIRSSSLMSNHSVTFFVPMGSVNFVPSREDLELTSRTKKTIDECRESFHKHFSVWLSQQTEQEPTLKLAYKKNFEVKKEHSIQYPLKWRGEDLPVNRIGFAQYDWVDDLDDLEKPIYYLPRYVDDFDVFNDDIFIANFNCKKFTRAQARKIQKFFEDESKSVNKIIMLPSDLDDRYIPNEDNVYDWMEIRKTRIKKYVPKAKKVAKNEWEGVEANGASVVMFEPDKSKNIYYSGRKKLNGSSVYYDVARNGDQFCFVIDSKKEKFLKLYPNAKPIKEWYSIVVKDYLKNLSAKDLKDMSYNVYNSNLFELNVKDVDDPELKKIIESMKGVNAASKVHERYLSYWQKMTWDERKVLPWPSGPNTNSGREVIKKYPLISNGIYCHGVSDKVVNKHVLFYINAAYKDMQNGDLNG